jgi:gamma-glutamyltranspeptidase/glutathione hydrolase
MVSTTQTLNGAFGSHVTVPGTGMLMNNCMMLFDPRPGGRQSVGPSKRPVSSNAPTIILRDGKPMLALGAPGATRIPVAVLQTIVNVIDHGMPLQNAVEAPRCHTGSEGEGLLLEHGFAVDVESKLGEMGHSVSRVPRVAGGLGAVAYRDDGTLEGAACWRADGAPAGISGGLAVEPVGGLQADIV